jgi:hypothetical protein
MNNIDSDGEIPAISFINIGKSLSEEKDKLKEVPRHKKITDHSRKNLETDVWSHVEDPRWIFLNAPENRDKYYYVRRGGPNQILPARCVDCGPSPVDNILEPLGRFTRVEMINTYGSNLRDNYRHYWIWFDNIAMTQRVSENDQLYYTDEPPVVPLSIDDIPQLSGGKKTKKYRKKNKKHRTNRNVKVKCKKYIKKT